MKLSKNIFNVRNIIIVMVVLVVGGVIYMQTRTVQSPYEFVSVRRGDISQEVSVTGRVKPADNVDLSFEKSGAVLSILVKVGDRISRGQILATLNTEEILSQISQAIAGVESAKASFLQYQSAVDAQQAKLDELRQGSRSEEILISETKVANAQNSLADTENNLVNVKNKAQVDLSNLYDIKPILTDAYLKADDAINKQIDDMFSNDSSADPQLTFFTSSQAEGDAEWKRKNAGVNLAQLKLGIDSLPSSQANLDSLLDKTANYLNFILDSLDSLNDALTYSSGLSSATLANYRYDANTARTNVNTAITSANTRKQAIIAQKATNQSNITTAEASVNTAKNILASAQDDLNLKKAGATAQQLSAQLAALSQTKAAAQAQEAQIKSAQAILKNYQAQLAKSQIQSPINGIVTKQDAKIGEIASAGKSVISIISDTKFQIETNVTEADIAKVKIGNGAKITLDAYGNNVIFNGLVVAIDPAETMLEGVATYKVTLQFEKDDERIKSGMTANIDILTNERQNVLLVPQRAVRQKEGGQQFILIDVGAKDPIEKEIVAGLKGADGNIEIISGLNEGDKIVNVVK